MTGGLRAADADFAGMLARHVPEGTLGPAGPDYLGEPRGRVVMPGALLARPRTVAEVARIVRICHEARVGIVPRGGGTGLVLGQVAPDPPAPLLLSLERMRAQRGIWPEEGALAVEAGVTLAEAQAMAAAAGRLFPLSLASEGSARIGGVLSTNAGGVAVLRYGMARDLCLGLEAVLPDGSVLGGMKRLRKDNTGYDLRHLLIGAEGTLGVITGAVLRLVATPAGRATAMMRVPAPGAALSLLALAQARSGGMVSGFELIGGTGLRFLSEVLPTLRQPLEGHPPWSVLCEIELAEGMDGPGLMAGLFEAGAAAGLTDDGVIAATAAQAGAMWRLRENLPEANRRIGAIASHDISLPLSRIDAFVAQAEEEIGRLGPYRINCFGHLGDGNLHFNVFPPPGEDRARHMAAASEIQQRIHDLVDRMDGSFSAEHGIGRLKTAALLRYGDPVRLQAMRAIKAALDPHGIMNPGAVLG